MKRKPKRKASILQGERKECFITGETGFLHVHHIYYGSGRRDISDEHGFWVWLKPEIHTMSEIGVHGRDGHALDLKLKQVCQRAYERTNSRESFMSLIKKNYLED